MAGVNHLDEIKQLETGYALQRKINFEDPDDIHMINLRARRRSGGALKTKEEEKTVWQPVLSWWDLTHATEMA
ncbi:hypothetical protein RUM43_000535 [Polyplax serrata]|uniref:Uncharacterized protein n=1 Tax=Polyplax serrata TaxID=468196 RepID=A0AAN8SCK9_POLSC